MTLASRKLPRQTTLDTHALVTPSLTRSKGTQARQPWSRQAGRQSQGPGARSQEPGPGKQGQGRSLFCSAAAAAASAASARAPPPPPPYCSGRSSRLLTIFPPSLDTSDTSLARLAVSLLYVLVSCGTRTPRSRKHRARTRSPAHRRLPVHSGRRFPLLAGQLESTGKKRASERDMYERRRDGTRVDGTGRDGQTGQHKWGLVLQTWVVTGWTGQPLLLLLLLL